MMRLALALGLLAAACSSGPTAPACAAIVVEDICNARVDCAADRCPTCASADPVFSVCREVTAQQQACPIRQCSPPPCDDAHPCPGSQVCAVREASFSGGCPCDGRHCSTDAECDGGTLCDDTPCHCGRVCVAPCKVASCPDGTFCATNGHCEPSACSGGTGCPDDFVCDAGACERPGCTASATSATCVNDGTCVRGQCFPGRGFCL